MSEGIEGGEGQPEEQQQPETETVETLQAKLAQYKDIASKQEKRAKENAAAAKRLAELEEAQKSDAEKAADRISKAEAEAASVPAKVAEALKAHLVALHSIEADDAELFLTATDPELLLKQVSRLVDSSGKRQKKNHVPREGANPNPAAGSNDMREFARGLFNRGD